MRPGARGIGGGRNHPSLPGKRLIPNGSTGKELAMARVLRH